MNNELHNDIFSYLRELNHLTQEGEGSVYEAAIIRAEKESYAETRKKLIDVIESIVEKEYLDKGTTKAKIYARSSEEYRNAIEQFGASKEAAGLAKAEHEKRLNRLNAVHACIIAEQSLMKVR